MSEKRNRRFKRNIRQFLALSAVSLGVIGRAYGAAADETVRETTNQVLTAIGSSSDEQPLQQVVENKVVPLFDFRRMAHLAAGRIWAEATPEQQDRLVNEFQQLLVRTYTTALAESEQRRAQVTVRAARAPRKNGETTVRTLLSAAGTRPTAIDYRMVNEQGDWKVIDVTVENVSLVTRYRDWFAAEAAAGGVDGVIRALAADNRNAA